MAHQGANSDTHGLTQHLTSQSATVSLTLLAAPVLLGPTGGGQGAEAALHGGCAVDQGRLLVGGEQRVTPTDSHCNVVYVAGWAET